MKKLTFGVRVGWLGMLLVTAFLLGAASPVYAWYDKACGVAGACGGKSACGMGGCAVCGHGMKQNPVVREFFRDAHKALSQREALGLSAEQVDAIKQLKRQMLDDVVQREADPNIFQAELEAALGRRPLDVNGLHVMIDQRTSDAGRRVKQAVVLYAELQGVIGNAAPDAAPDATRDATQPTAPEGRNWTTR